MADASFSWEQGTGSVRYDTTRTDPDTFLAELHRRTDYRAAVAPGGDPKQRGQEHGS